MNKGFFFVLFSILIIKSAYSQEKSIRKTHSEKKQAFNLKDKNGRLQGYWKIASPDDMGHFSNMSEGFVFNDKKIGVWHLTDYTGLIIEDEIYYDTSQRKIQLIRYHKNGNVKLEGFKYKSFKRDTVEAFDPRVGKNVLFITDSILMKQGKWNSYFDNGILESTGSYKNDKKFGEWKYYNAKGELLKTEEYKIE